MPYKKNRRIKRFWNKLLSKKGKKSNTSASETTLCTKKKFCTQKKLCIEKFWVQNSICDWKKNHKKFLWDNFKITSPYESATHKVSIYGNCKISIFFKKQKILVFSTPGCFIRINKPEINLYLFSTIYRNCLKKILTAIFHTLDVCNDMISNFGAWRSV